MCLRLVKKLRGIGAYAVHDCGKTALLPLCRIVFTRRRQPLAGSTQSAGTSCTARERLHSGMAASAGRAAPASSSPVKSRQPRFAQLQRAASAGGVIAAAPSGSKRVLEQRSMSISNVTPPGRTSSV